MQANVALFRKRNIDSSSTCKIYNLVHATYHAMDITT